MTERQEFKARAELLVAVPDPAQRAGVEAWLNSPDLATRTAEEYAKTARIFVRWLAARGPVDLAAVDQRAVRSFIAAQRDARNERTGRPLSVRTVRCRVATISSLLLFLSDENVRVGNPATDVKRPKAIKGGGTPVLSKADARRLYGGTAEPDDVIIGLMYVSMMRVSELCRADVGGIITRDGERVLRVKTKGSKERDVPLPPRMLASLTEYLGDRKDGSLVLNTRGDRPTRSFVVALLRRVGTAKGVRDSHKLRPHMIRASGITHALDAGVPINKVQRAAGHEDPSTTQGYHERSEGARQDREVAEVLEGILWDDEGLAA